MVARGVIAGFGLGFVVAAISVLVQMWWLRRQREWWPYA